MGTPPYWGLAEVLAEVLVEVLAEVLLPLAGDGVACCRLFFAAFLRALCANGERDMIDKGDG